MTDQMPELVLDGGTPFDDMDVVDGGGAVSSDTLFDGGKP